MTYDDMLETQRESIEYEERATRAIARNAFERHVANEPARKAAAIRRAERARRAKLIAEAIAENPYEQPWQPRADVRHWRG